ncbi:MAG: thermonuclease family protein [Hoeflea sp.]|uniref:thermonuclease family protein n=1 Tax=Hoeflea sp. TaxID=1940281 RepID=UPI0032EE27EE
MVARFRSRRRSRPLWRRLVDILIALSVIAAVAFAAAFLERRSAETFAGQVRVIDGDSLAMGERRLRLKGIDAPELAQRCRRDSLEYACGMEARTKLRALIGADTVSCVGEGVDRYGRDLVRCEAGGRDLNRIMVRSGHAVSFGDYGAEERLARRQGAGLWAGDFDMPKEWRALHGGLGEDVHGGFAALRALLHRLTGL